MRFWSTPRLRVSFLRRECRPRGTRRRDLAWCSDAEADNKQDTNLLGVFTYPAIRAGGLFFLMGDAG